MHILKHILRLLLTCMRYHSKLVARGSMRFIAYLQKNCLNARNRIDTPDHFLHHLVNMTIGGVKNYIYLLGPSCRHGSRY